MSGEENVAGGTYIGLSGAHAGSPSSQLYKDITRKFSVCHDSKSFFDVVYTHLRSDYPIAEDSALIAVVNKGSIPKEFHEFTGAKRLANEFVKQAFVYKPNAS